MNTKKVINNIVGVKRKFKDTDGDKTPDYKDCQPNNTMHQDVITNLGTQRIRQIQDRFNYPQQEAARDMMVEKRLIQSKIY